MKRPYPSEFPPDPRIEAILEQSRKASALAVTSGSRWYQKPEVVFAYRKVASLALGVGFDDPDVERAVKDAHYVLDLGN